MSEKPFTTADVNNFDKDHDQAKNNEVYSWFSEILILF